MMISSMSPMPHPSDAPAYYDGSSLRRTAPSQRRSPPLSTTTRTHAILDSTAGEGLRRSVLMRNALARSVAARHAAELRAQHLADELPAYETYHVSTRDYDEDEEEEYDDAALRLPSVEAASVGGDGIDAEEQWFDELLGEVSRAELPAAPLFIDATDSSLSEEEDEEEEDLESLAEARHSRRLALARRSSASSLSSSSVSSLPGLDTDDSDSDNDELASSASSLSSDETSCDSPPPTPTDAPLAPAWNIKAPQLPQPLDLGPPALA